MYWKTIKRQLGLWRVMAIHACTGAFMYWKTIKRQLGLWRVMAIHACTGALGT
ncbi:hypothetical protein [Roseiflexus sp.]|uniref:hypothetical protein n=1 Tax=Roseiflexus sp. TaxID=2562120 RepID=UPI00398B49D1